MSKMQKPQQEKNLAAALQERENTKIIAVAGNNMKA